MINPLYWKTHPCRPKSAMRWIATFGILAVILGPCLSSPSHADARDDAAQASFASAFVFYHDREFAKAVDKFDLGLRLKPDSVMAHYYMAESLTALGRTDEATAHYEAAARLGPNVKEGLLASALLSQRREAAEAAQRRKREQDEAVAAAEKQRRDAEAQRVAAEEAARATRIRDALKSAQSRISRGAHVEFFRLHEHCSSSYPVDKIDSILLPNIADSDGRLYVNNNKIYFIETIVQWLHNMNSATSQAYFRFDASYDPKKVSAFLRPDVVTLFFGDREGRSFVVTLGDTFVSVGVQIGAALYRGDFAPCPDNKNSIAFAEFGWLQSER